MSETSATSVNPDAVVRRFDQRLWRIAVAGAVLPDGLDCEFEIRKSRKHEPNSCRLEIYNLSPESRGTLEGLSQSLKQSSKGTGKGSFKQVGLQTGDIRVEIEAGYKDVGTSLLFRGDLRNASTTRRAPDLVTTIVGEDGGRTILESRVSASFAPGTTFETVAKYCAARMGVGAGNLAAVFNGGLPGLNLPSLNVYANGTTLDGSAPDELRNILAGLGVSYSVQDGVIQCRAKKGYIPTQLVELGPGSGLIESPVRDSNGYVKATCLIQPSLIVDGRVRFNTADFQSEHTIHTVTYKGNTRGTEWYAELEVK